MRYYIHFISKIFGDGKTPRKYVYTLIDPENGMSGVEWHQIDCDEKCFPKRVCSRAEYDRLVNFFLTERDCYEAWQFLLVPTSGMEARQEIIDFQPQEVV